MAMISNPAVSAMEPRCSASGPDGFIGAPLSNCPPNPGNVARWVRPRAISRNGSSESA